MRFFEILCCGCDEDSAAKPLLDPAANSTTSRVAQVVAPQTAGAGASGGSAQNNNNASASTSQSDAASSSSTTGPGTPSTPAKSKPLRVKSKVATDNDGHLGNSLPSGSVIPTAGRIPTPAPTPAP